MLRHAAIASTLYEVHPKYHLWVHLVAEVGRRGNPRFYDTFLSEAHNLPLKNVCRALHQLTFERRGLARMREVLARKAPPQKRARG
jgi:hypothetical protein